MNLPEYATDLSHFVPGVMPSQTVPSIRDTPGASVATLLTALDSFPYRAVHALDVVDRTERAEFGAIVRERGLWLDFCVSRALSNRKLSLSSADAANRLRAVETVVELIPHGVEQGARYLSLSSGTGHENEADRPDAIARFAESLTAIIESLRTTATGLLIEPMDVFIDKRGSLGYAHEALHLVRSLGAPDADVRLICDTAHLRLNDETPEAMVAQGAECIAAIHLCNCCVDPSDPLYGDKHIRPGAPGVFDLDGFHRTLTEIAPRFAEPSRSIPVFIEYRNHGDPVDHLAYLATSLGQALGCSIE